MKRLKETRRLILYNWKPLLEFEVLYKLTTAVIFAPILWRMFDFIMELSGYSYLTLENIFAFLTKPLTLALLLILLIFATVYAMIDISAVIFVLDQSRQEQRFIFHRF